MEMKEKMTIEELESLFSENGYIWLGHGTGSSGDSIDTINQIFEEGLRTKDNSLCLTSIVLSTPTPEIIERNKDLDMEIPTIESLKKCLNNWKHRDSKKIILIRLPIDYVNWQGDRDDYDNEMYGAFTNEMIMDNGDIKYYLDSRFILGCFDANTEMIRINNNFEINYSIETKQKLTRDYLKALKKTKKRLERTRLFLNAPSMNVNKELNETNY